MTQDPQDVGGLALRRQWMSALVDGETPPGAQAEAPAGAEVWADTDADSSALEARQSRVERACALWADDPAAREAWHTYHLIGDALRASDLVTRPAADPAFLSALRERLALEPVHLVHPATPATPTPPLPSRMTRWTGWRPAALAAGIAGAVVALGVLRMQAPAAPGGEPLLSATPVPGVVPVAQSPALTSALGEPPWQVVEGKLIRDARLDSYLRSQRAARPVGSSPRGAPGRVETVSIER